jgi:hypothetical protein
MPLPLGETRKKYNEIRIYFVFNVKACEFFGKFIPPEIA